MYVGICASKVRLGYPFAYTPSYVDYGTPKFRRKLFRCYVANALGRCDWDVCSCHGNANIACIWYSLSYFWLIAWPPGSVQQNRHAIYSHAVLAIRMRNYFAVFTSAATTAIISGRLAILVIL